MPTGSGRWLALTTVLIAALYRVHDVAAALGRGDVLPVDDSDGRRIPVWSPAAAYLACSGDWGKAILLTSRGVLVVGSIDKFLSPRLVGKRTRLHELLIFFSVLGGLQVFGVLGLVLGPVTVAVTLALFEVVREANRPPEKTRREDTVIERQADVRQAS